MRKVTELDSEWEFPYNIVETQEDGYIISITNPYVSGYNEDDTPIYTDVNENLIGSPATWADVNNLFLFDLKIGENLYSWDNKEGFIYIGMRGTKIGLIKYISVRTNGKFQGYTKKTTVPSMFGNPALEIINGNICVSGVPYSDAPFYDVSTSQMRTLSEIKKIKDGVEYNIAFPEREWV